MRSADEYARLRRYEYVAAPGSPLVCVGESFGSYNFQLKDEVYPRDKPFIPVANPWGSIDYLPNPNHQPVNKSR
jgi:hypothetical protein